MKNNAGKYYITVTAEAFGTTGQLNMNGYCTSDLDFPGSDFEFDTFETAKSAAEEVDLQTFVDVVLNNMRWETTEIPDGGCIRVEVIEGDGGLVGYEPALDGGVEEIKSINVGCRTARAELEGRDLSAECPECGKLDGYLSTGEHSENGTDFVRCSGCGNWFYINW